MIAKNSTAGVGWKTADPVTGTVGYVGTSAGTVEEFEPLGQKLHLTDPEPLPDPVPTESAWRNADYPDWMCEPGHAYLYYGEFHAWPEACQSKYRNEMSIVPITITEKKESPEKIPTGTDSPIPRDTPDNGATYAANSMRAEALTSTTKDDNDTDCRPGRPCLPEETLNVSIGLDMSEIPGFVDASQSDHATTPSTGDCEKLAVLVDNIAVVSRNADAFIKDLVNQVIGNLDTSSSEDFEKANAIPGARYGDSGFKKEFQDGSNQVRHFVGGLWAGYLYGPGVAQLGMNSNETNSIIDGRGIRRSVAGILPTLFPTKDSKADIALNSVSVGLGTQLVPRAEESRDVGDRGWRKIPAQTGFKGLAAQIRARVCD